MAKYKDKNSKISLFFFGGGGNKSYVNNIVYLFVTVATFDSAGWLTIHFLERAGVKKAMVYPSVWLELWIKICQCRDHC